jgi:hypothetical protein
LCYVLPHLTLFVSRQYIKPSLWFCAYGAEDVFELSNSHDQELTLDGHLEIQKQSTLEEADESESEHIEKTRMLLKLTGLDLFKLACRCLSTLIQANIDKQQMDKELKGCLPACCEEIGKEKKKALSHQIYCLISTSHV